MLYREPSTHNPVAKWLKHVLVGFGAVRTKRRRADTDLRSLSPYLQRDLGFMDSGYPR